MSEHDPFWRQIFAEPTVDFPRLIYADWLEERGATANAELLRLHCEMFPLAESDARRRSFQRRSDELERVVRREWIGRLPAEVTHVQFMRGLPQVRFHCPAHELLARGPKWFSKDFGLRTPVYWRCVYRGSSPRDFLDLASCPWLKNFVSLNLQYIRLAAEEIEALVSSDYLDRLITLSLAETLLGSRIAEVLTRSLRLPQLILLDLSRNQMTAVGAAQLAKAKWLDSLIGLDLGGNAIGVDGVKSLVTSKYLTSLRMLHLNSNKLGDEGAVVLATASRLKYLKALDVSANRIGNDGVMALVKSRKLRDLTNVSLHSPGLRHDVACAFEKRFGGESHMSPYWLDSLV